MQRTSERCAGPSVVACVMVVGPDGALTSDTHTFGATTPDLLALRDVVCGYHADLREAS